MPPTARSRDVGRRLRPGRGFPRSPPPGPRTASAMSRAGVGRVDIIRAFLMDAFARWLVRHPLAVVVANLVVTVVLGLFALHVRIENSLESMLPSGDPKVD